MQKLLLFFISILLTPLFAAEQPEECKYAGIASEVFYSEHNKTIKEAEKQRLLLKQKDQWRLEKGRKWRIKKNVNGVNFVDRGTPPTKRIKVVADCGHEDC